MNIKEFYLENYPTDDLGTELKETANFTGLLNPVNQIIKAKNMRQVKK